MATANFTGLELLGKSISYRDLSIERILPNTLLTSYTALVVAVQVPLFDSDIEPALLLRFKDTSSIDEYVTFDDILVLSTLD
jgi:hypothetical protein